MADSDIHDLTENASPAGEDEGAFVDDPSGSPVTKKMTLTTLASWLASLTQTLTNKTLNVWVAKGVKDNGNSGSTQSIDWSQADRHKLTLTDDCTISFSNASEGQIITLIIKQDATGGRSITWPGALMWPDSGTEPTWGTSANDINVVSVYYDGTNYLAQGAVNFA